MPVAKCHKQNKLAAHHFQVGRRHPDGEEEHETSTPTFDAATRARDSITAMRIYGDLAPWYPLMTPASDYADEADHLLRLIDAVCEGPSETLLELGAGPGHMASHLKRRLRCTLTDLSPQMLDLSRALNPECTHVLADMRLLDLQDRFDVVLAQDAIDYMTTEADLKSAIATASKHLRPGGVAVFIPDHVKDTFQAVSHLRWA